IRALGVYLCETHGPELKRYYHQLRPESEDKASDAGPVIQTAGLHPVAEQPEAVSLPAVSEEPVAVVGAYGIFPQSEDLRAFWDHLGANRDLITEVPKDRWDWSAYHKGSADEKTYLKWGGFIAGVDRFDPLFFNISPRDAEMMDPQHRLFIQTVWKTVEDAGYSAATLSGQSVGLFVGVQHNDYVHLLASRAAAQTATGTGHAMLANRVSYFMNWHGPSEAVDTACSSSLVALHRAVRSIRSGESRLAVAGGVSLMLYPGTMIGAGELGVLSPDGRCKTFDRSANGYVKGEGVGAVLLKPLNKAVADNDHIYAVIKATAVNHGGKANSLTAPNSDAQAALLTAAYEAAGIDPDTVTYLELHGTGTELGDPVEVEGIKKAFSDLAKRTGRPIERTRFCGLGAVKTNIGHLEPASGIAGVIKVLLSMAHGKLPGTPHLKELNPYIELEDTPFYVVEKTKPWNRLEDGNRRPIPRRAGVSSFGFGGANAHVVLEEYQEPVFRVQSSEFKVKPQLIVLSAKNEERLLDYAKALLRFMDESARMPEPSEEKASREQTREALSTLVGDIFEVAAKDLDPDETFESLGLDQVGSITLADKVNERYALTVNASHFMEYSSINRLTQYIITNHASHIEYRESSIKNRVSNIEHRASSIENIAFTLQVGRDAMAHRMAMVVSGFKDLQGKLTQYIRTQKEAEDLFLGNIKTDEAKSEGLIEGKEGKAFVDSIIKERKLSKLARLWVSGTAIDWMTLYPDDKPRRVSLPTYPFAEDRFWIPEKAGGMAHGAEGKSSADRLHPLLGSNTSTLKEQQYTTLFTGEEFYLTDHVVAGRKTLPGVAYLEMARAAAEMAGEPGMNRLSNVVWIRPIGVTDAPQTVHIRLMPQGEAIGFYVVTKDDAGKDRVHAQGKISSVGSDSGPRDRLDIKAVKADSKATLNRDDCYRMFRSAGLDYGPGFRVVEKIFLTGKKALSRWVLPEAYRESRGMFVLHPAIMDGALQTVLGLMGQVASETPYLPYTIGEVKWFRPLGYQGYALAGYAGNPGSGELTFDIDLLDETGAVAVGMKDFTTRAVKQKTAAPVRIYYKAEWEASPVRSHRVEPASPILLFDTDTERRDTLSGRLNTGVILVLPGERYEQLDEKTYTICPEDRKGYHQVLSCLAEAGRLPECIVHLWSQDEFSPDKQALDRQLERGFYSIFHITQAFLDRVPAESIRLLYLFREPAHGAQPQYAAMAGFVKTLRLEHPKLACRTIGVAESMSMTEAVITEIRGDGGMDIRYRDNLRWERRLETFDLLADSDGGVGLKENGVYLLTGGAGGLGLIFADFLARKTKARLVLTGRSELDRTQTQRIQALNDAGARVIYIPTDIAHTEAVVRLKDRIKARFGEINGILHAAGLTRDATIVKKNPDEMAPILAPKVFGTVCLDEVFQSEPIDFFMMFSSVAAMIGNPGQCDYAFANSFMDHFVTRREALRKAGKRYGKTLSINWPLWRDGGMGVDRQTETFLKETLGMVLLDSSEGWEAFEQGLASGSTRFMLIKGQRPKLERWMAYKPDASSSVQGESDAPGLREAAGRALRSIVSEILKMDFNAIDADEEISTYGFDSISFTELANRINGSLGLEVTPALFFEYTTLESLAAFLCEAYADSLAAHFQGRRSKSPSIEIKKSPSQSRFRIPEPVPDAPRTAGEMPIAVIGMSAVMPGSENPEKFWQHLTAGDDLINEVPADRWDWKSLYGDPATEPNKTRAKWGGFIADVDRFDPLFFGISPKEAELMDPQQRLFLETVWKTIEDAGYRAADVAGTDTGLFVGVAANDYAELLGRCASEIEAHTSTGMSHSMLPNRISYLLDLHGPSEPIDTACSSSLVAIHRAVEAIRSGTCEMAIAGGVNVILTPTATISFDKAGMLSPDGRCKTFDKRADGYVRGEGVGAVMLKPMDRAVADGDWIYAVIRGTAVNHGGKANSLTAPNPKAQTSLIVKAYERAKIPAHTVGYIEAHGTGTSLGDPIEINALKNAFSALYEREKKPIPEAPCCGLGSVKTNIGHLETAAGIAGVIKVLLALKHRKLPPNIHFEELNPYIELVGSPFFIVTENRDWEPPVDENGNRLPRRAGISSFGFGGANAHVVLEEYQEPEVRGEGSEGRGHSAESIGQGGNKRETLEESQRESSIASQLIVLSAKNEERLREYAKRMADFLEIQHSKLKIKNLSIADIAYTLQTGREPFERRLAIVATDLKDAESKLKQFAQGSDAVEGLFLGHTKSSGIHTDLLTKGAAGEAFLQLSIEKKEFHNLGQLWVSGIDIDWNRLHENLAPRRIPLPTYPFARERYWLPVAKGAPAAPPPVVSAPRKNDPNSAPVGIFFRRFGQGAADIPLEKRVEAGIQEIAAEIVKLDAGRLDPEESLGLFGFDSITLKQLSNKIGRLVEVELPPSIFFAHGTIRGLSRYLVDTFGNKIRSIYGDGGDLTPVIPGTEDGVEPVDTKAASINDATPPVMPDIRIPEAGRYHEQDFPVAIIGAHGLFPESQNLTEFWNHLEAADHLIGEVPKDRWNWQDFSIDPETGKERPYVKWGGFIKDVDKFDPAFFKISPREAEMMDPQHRLFTEVVWKTIEDAGYDATALSDRFIGIFAGLQFNDYQQMLVRQSRGDAQISTGTANSMLTNRISFLMNWHGPSESIDTACSGSLVAVHRAVKSIQTGECEMAVAGGVSLMLSPASMIGAGSLGVLSPKGRCKALDKDADGYVKGEGVGAVFLKPLDRAIADHDHIYAIIRGSAVNHGGKATSLTAPSSEAQAALLYAAYRNAGIEADTVTFLELHGTGTELGDPVEIDGIKKAFAHLLNGKTPVSETDPFCGIGSVKTNIGHLEPAAGIAGLFKLMLAMAHGKLPATLHLKELNPLIKLEQTPFYVVDQTRAWKRLTDTHGNPIPRRAGVSAFGFGGTNAHIILEEYEQNEVRGQGAEVRDEPQLIVLSAKNEERLRKYAEDMVEFIDRQKSKTRHTDGGQVENRKPATHTAGKSSIEDIAYTLQAGRQPMAERLALVASTLEELALKLKRFAQGHDTVDELHRGTVRVGQSRASLMVDDKEGESYILSLMKGWKLGKLAKMWVNGVDFDWDLLHPDRHPFRVSLPTYPFARERYWLPQVSDDKRYQTVETPMPETESIPGAAPGSLCFEPDWKLSAIDIESESKSPGGPLLILGAGEADRDLLTGRLSGDMVLVVSGSRFRKIDPQTYEIDPADTADYERLFQALQQKHGVPKTVVHLWALDSKVGKIDADMETQLQRGVYSVFLLLKAIANSQSDPDTRIFFFGPDEPVNPFFEAVSGYGRSIRFAMPKVNFTTVQVSEAGKDLADIICAEMTRESGEEFPEVRYRKGQRYIRSFRPIALGTEGTGVGIRHKGVYLITGGAGGLGMILARYLKETYRAVPILTGRSPLAGEKHARLEEIFGPETEGIYFQADISNREQMIGVIETVRKRFGPLNGVIHAAGVSSIAPIHMKDAAEFAATVKPKIHGTLVLDSVTREEPLDFFMLFSSTSALLGDFGQGDYAVANRFLDGFARYRETLKAQGARRGRTLSINWPLWRDGGLHMNPEMETFYFQTSGMTFLETETGLTFFERVLKSEACQAGVISGDLDRISRFLGMDRMERAPDEAMDVENVGTGNLVSDLRQIAARVLKTDAEKLDADESLADFGFDSIMLKLLADDLNAVYGIEVSPSLFFAHPTINRLAAYLAETYGGLVKHPEPKPMKAARPVWKVEDEADFSATAGDTTDLSHEPIAVVGMHGVFPGSRNLSEFWKHLENGINLVSEIPKDRWDWRDYFGDPTLDPGKTDSKWGGFITDMDKFDPRFFKISPREAEMMDPQHRLFIETVWKAVEDAGIRASSLSGAIVGVFAGLQFKDYEQLMAKGNQSNAYSGTGIAMAMLANRVSYLMNWHGPSETIDTACSSSLVAVNRAVKSLRNRECDMAVAGGVSLLLSPLTLIGASQLGVLSPDGRCRTLDKRANGYVKGEGVGAVLLKPLSRAMADEDPIHAVIRGAAVNHGGSAASLTAPNPAAQSALLIKAYAEAAVDPDTVSYLELHGTGTELGDPVEIDGIKQAFDQMSSKLNRPIRPSHRCGLGSVKTNIGHLEPAAGIAALVKVILSLKHGKLPGILNFKSLNPFIDLKGTPFYVVEKTKAWERLKDEAGRDVPRRAGVSSFGFGGTNAHVVLEEYQKEEFRVQGSGFRVDQQLIVLSAKNKERLREYAASFAKFLELETRNSKLENIAYTLQVGREEMPERLAIPTDDLNELVAKLNLFVDGRTSMPGVYRGRVPSGSAVSPDSTLQEIDQGKLTELIQQRRLDRLAEAWIRGADIDWELLNKDANPRRTSLPTYPFARERYWIPNKKAGTAHGAMRYGGEAVTVLHPLIDTNESTFEEQRFKKVLRKTDFFLKDHVIGGRPILPGVVYLEMARAAGDLAFQRSAVTRISNAVWTTPIMVSDEPTAVYIRLKPGGTRVAFEVYSDGESGGNPIHAQGWLFYGRPKLPDVAPVDIETMIERLPEVRHRGECYRLFQAAGLDYGPAFQAIHTLYSDGKEALSRLVLPESVKDTLQTFVLHPSLMDGALQTVSGLMGGETVDSPYLPFVVKEVLWLRPLTPDCYAHALPVEGGGESEIRQFDVKIFDGSGKPLVIINGFSLKAFEKGSSKILKKDQNILQLLEKLSKNKISAQDVKQQIGLMK
ncbi:MAG TPA: SDR family NAD(P)-dependent oxidoreductase, partial [Deltaproteobacteria bacterium]|nr:SDR family NAD(P)-dependent oxidoreductase [Deltaproteobacteria bacterium]